MENDDIAAHSLWLALILLTGMVAAVLAAAVFWLVKAGPAAVFTAGGTTFLGVSSLGTAIRRFLTGIRD